MSRQTKATQLSLSIICCLKREKEYFQLVGTFWAKCKQFKKNLIAIRLFYCFLHNFKARGIIALFKRNVLFRVNNVFFEK